MLLKNFRNLFRRFRCFAGWRERVVGRTCLVLSETPAFLRLKEILEAVLTLEKSVPASRSNARRKEIAGPILSFIRRGCFRRKKEISPLGRRHRRTASNLPFYHKVDNQFKKVRTLKLNLEIISNTNATPKRTVKSILTQNCSEASTTRQKYLNNICLNIPARRDKKARNKEKGFRFLESLCFQYLQRDSNPRPTD